MSGQISSPWLTQNELYYPRFANQQLAQGDQQYAQNQLAMQTTQQALGEHEQEMMARAASGVLALPDESARAAAYPSAVADLQRYGFAKNAPSVYPGEAALRRVAMMGTPSTTLYTYGQNQQANAAVLGAGGAPGGAGGTAGGGGTPAQAPYPAPGGAYGQGGKGAAVEVPKEYLPYYQEASAKYGIPVDLLIAQHRQESGFNANAVGRAGEIGIGQIMPSTAMAPGYGQAPADPATLRDPRANIMFSAEYLARRMRGDPRDPEVQRRALVAYNGGGDPNYVANVTRYLPSSYPQTQTAAIQAQPQATPPPGGAVPSPDAQAAMTDQQWLDQQAKTYPSLAGPNVNMQAGTQPPAEPPQGTPGAPGAPAPYQVASTQPVAPPGPTAPPAATPTGPPNGLAPQPVGTQGLVRNQDGSVGPPNAGGLATPQPQQQAQTTPPPAGPGPAAPAPGQPASLQPVARTLQLPPMDAENLTAQDRASLAAMARSPGTTPAQLLERKSALQNINQQRVKDAQAQANAEFNQQIELQKAQNPMQSRAVEGEATWDGTKWTPTTPGQEGTSGKWVYAGNQRVAFEPASTRPAAATFELQRDLHKRDTEALPEYNAQNMSAAGNMIRIQQMRELVDQISTGAGGAERANWANIADTLGWHDLAKRLIGVGGAAAAQEFAKYGLSTAGAQERGDLGARGSLGAITLYKSANPGLELQPDANKKMLTAQLIAAQANRDYTQQAMDYVNRNGDQFVRGGNYTPLSHFDSEWAASRNPQIYAAAMGAINGDSWDKWTKALNMKSPDDVQRVIDIVRRADPTSTILFKDNERHAVTVQ